MPKAGAQDYNLELTEFFEDSTLGIYLGDHAVDLFGLGDCVILQAGGALVPASGRRLVVVLEGCVTLEGEWYGPGNHFDQGSAVIEPLKGPARLWTLSLDGPAWNDPANLSLRRMTARALMAAAQAEARATPDVDLPDPTTLCDSDHPDIRRRAARLRRASPVSTAEAIMQYVHTLPYRFGTWQERASDTMARGVGMCTTKANLQVALMRAAGLEAGFVEIPMSTKVLGNLMPRPWLALQRDTVKHYFAAVKLDGRWHAVDSSYDRASYRIYLETFPWMAHRETPTLKIGEPYCPALEIQEGADLFGFEVRSEINEEMGKKSRFLPRHFEALNTRMDRARGVHLGLGGQASTVEEPILGMSGEITA